MSSTSIELSNQSCFDFLKNLPNNSVDLFLIDPPYEVSRDTNFQSGELKGDNTDRFRVSMDFGDWDSGFTGLDTVISEAYRVLRKGGTLICFYDLWKLTTLKEYFEKAKFKQLRFIEWLKTNPVPINSKTNYLTNAREIAILGVKGGRPTFHSEYDKPANDAKRQHCTVCKQCGKRFDARTMGYQVGWICGDENTKVCTGCFWYDIEKFNHEVSKGFVKTA